MEVPNYVILLKAKKEFVMKKYLTKNELDAID